VAFALTLLLPASKEEERKVLASLVDEVGTSFNFSS
jgi:hypothetical protein